MLTLGIVLFLLFLIVAIASASSNIESLAVAGGVLSAITLIVLLVYLVGGYNKMVRYNNKVAESFSLVDVHLKMRFDLIPNLVETVKGYAKHETKIFENIAKLRNLGMNTTSETKKIDTANKIVFETNKLLAVAENYPELKADGLFKNLMQELCEVENKISASRRFYNSNINVYNSLVEIFPYNQVAVLFGFKKQDLFQIEVNERVLPKVNMEG